MAVLKLSTLYDFASVRALSIRQLEPLLLDVPLERLIIARKYSVHDWAIDACRQLVERDEPLSEKEAAQMEIADVVRIYTERESRARMRSADRSGCRSEVRPVDKVRGTDRRDLNDDTSVQETIAQTTGPSTSLSSSAEGSGGVSTNGECSSPSQDDTSRQPYGTYL